MDLSKGMKWGVLTLRKVSFPCLYVVSRASPMDRPYISFTSVHESDARARAEREGAAGVVASGACFLCLT